jgi:hypothetical protein
VADECRSGVVHHYGRAVGGAGKWQGDGRPTTALFASGLRNRDVGLEQHKGPVGWTRPGPLTPLTGHRLESQDGELSAAT